MVSLLDVLTYLHSHNPSSDAQSCNTGKDGLTCDILSRCVTTCRNCAAATLLDLTKIVQQVPASRKGGLVSLLVPYVLVEIDERRLNGSHGFYGDV